MVKVSEEQVRQAEVRAAEAEESRVQAARKLELSPYSDVAALEHGEASRLAAQLAANARELRQAFEEQVAEERRRSSRPELEKAAAGEIEAAGVALAERERGIVEALERAQEALVGVLAAGEAYNAVVQAQADALAGVGLDVRGGESGGDRTSLNRFRVKVKGRMFEELDAAALGAWVLWRVVEARAGRFHPLASGLEWTARAAALEAPVLSGVSAVEQSRHPRLADAFQAVVRLRR
ncbi:hypothetical protein [Streptomyces sp. NPDC020996]|uniref:hypothetical protein n=1 Tax=Streptomyces sp. NPDC020996 TaxID=3154791 RepID=UPI0033D73890